MSERGSSGFTAEDWHTVTDAAGIIPAGNDAVHADAVTRLRREQ